MLYFPFCLFINISEKRLASILTIMNNIVMNIVIQITISDFAFTFLIYLPRRKITGLYKFYI